MREERGYYQNTNFMLHSIWQRSDNDERSPTCVVSAQEQSCLPSHLLLSTMITLKIVLRDICIVTIDKFKVLSNMPPFQIM